MTLEDLGSKSNIYWHLKYTKHLPIGRIFYNKICDVYLKVPLAVEYETLGMYRLRGKGKLCAGTSTC